MQIELGHLDEASKSLQSALAVAEETSDWKAYNMRLATLARLQVQHGKFDEAFQLFRQSMEKMRVTGKRYDEAAVAGLMGKAYADLGDNEQAIACFEHARDIFQQLGLTEHVEQAIQNIETLKLRSSED